MVRIPLVVVVRQPSYTKFCVVKGINEQEISFYRCYFFDLRDLSPFLVRFKI